MSTTAMPVLDVSGVSFHRGSTPVLDDITFRLAAGEKVALRGPSGSGKSTLLGIVSGLVEPDRGSVEILGEAFGSLPERHRARIRRRSIGSVFQADEFIPELTLEENVELPLRLDRRRAARDGTVHDLLQRLGIGELADRRPSEVSGGQLQRAAVARALVTTPALVLADEPTGSLDEKTSIAAMRLLIEAAARQRAAVLVVTHSEHIAALCDRQLHLDHGALQEIPRSRRGPVSTAEGSDTTDRPGSGLPTSASNRFHG